jgi:hypothetical protein
MENIKNPAVGLFGSQAGTTTIAYLIAAALQLLLITAALAFVFFFITAGLSYISAGGDKTSIEAAKSKIMNAFIGLFIVVVTLAVVQIIGKILQLKSLQDLIFTIPIISQSQ